MNNLWLLPISISAGLQWVARWKNHRRLHLITKPAVMVFLIIWLWQSTFFRGFTYLFGLALLFSLLGDIFLMCPPSFFMAGLVSFLLGHIFYIIGFNTAPLNSAPGLWLIAILISLIMMYVILYYQKALKKRLISRKVRAGVIAYIIMLHLMIFTAFSTLWRPYWISSSAIIVTIGAALFGLSDSILAYNHFIRRIPKAHVWIMMSYHIAQISMIAGVIHQFVMVN